MSQQNAGPLPYSEAKFVDRLEEIKAVLAAVSKTRSAAPDRPHTVVFSGERGSGKSWLSFHLQRVILKRADCADVTSRLIRFTTNCVESASAAEKLPSDEKCFQLGEEPALRSLLLWVAEQVGATKADDASLVELSGWLARDVEKSFRDRILVLILDSVYELGWNQLNDLEKYLLAPLAGLRRTVIVMTGRGTAYPWKSPHLSYDVTVKPLSAFTAQVTIDQLALQVPNAKTSVEEIIKKGGGYPLNNYLLATEDDSVAALARIVDTLLSVVPEGRRLQIRRYLEALCVLEGFRGPEIPYMLNAYHNGTTKEDLEALQQQESDIRDQIVESRLARWEEGRFVIDRAVRIPIESSLRENEKTRDVWTRLQCAAYHYYDRSAARYPRFKKDFEERANRHRDALAQANVPLDECAPLPDPAERS